MPTGAPVCDPVTATLAATAVTAGVSIYQGEQARKGQNQARAAADRQFNAANPKKPNMAGIAADNLQAAGAGLGSTMLTGPGGAGAKLGGMMPLGG